MRTFLLFLVVCAAAAAGSAPWWWPGVAGDAKPRYRTQEVDRGEIVQAISANGTLNPVTVVNVGTQISGTVQSLHADFNQQVRAGQVLAELDPALIEAQIRNVEANLEKARANLRLAKTRESRTRVLVDKNFVVQSQLDDAIQTREAAEAEVAAIDAQLARERVNRRYAVIRSPISGVVVARNVDVGQTVAASFQTPTLYQIAKDLREMQIDASISEADVGRMREGLPVTFTVDAFPERRFSGEIRQVRLNPTIQQNVVTYNVVVSVDNADGALLPGMTAHVSIVLETRADALRVPNAALRFKPKAKEGEKRTRGPVVYRVRANGALEAVKIQIGISDSAYTEVISGELMAGEPLATGEEAGQRSGNASQRFRLRL